MVAFFFFGPGCTGRRVYQGTLCRQILPSEHRGCVFGIGGLVGGSLQPLALSLAILFADRLGGGGLMGLAAILLALSATEIFLLPMPDAREGLGPRWAPPSTPQAAERRLGERRLQRRVGV